ncbi:hypothetical protein T265_11399 [Opisthorchis viverrini]|uniref:Uncharacterized protein n=1 Tax=Opisthorchis viverrini TaxID=6198 RepID=A0A074ZXL7_OPIVI|nr:hypothetical protein T265_11399 [Opisthorchis viverrini]KER19954.1 hypothetical protein T265_11399 [Opisthorchis viverrini]
MSSQQAQGAAKGIELKASELGEFGGPNSSTSIGTCCVGLIMVGRTSTMDDFNCRDHYGILVIYLLSYTSHSSHLIAQKRQGSSMFDADPADKPDYDEHGYESPGSPYTISQSKQSQNVIPVKWLGQEQARSKLDCTVLGRQQMRNS